MKIPLFSILLCISIYASGQVIPKYNYNTKNFDTYFRNIKKGNFRGFANGLMQFEYKDSIKFIASFSKDSAQLNFEPDLNEIYDVSYKQYFVRTNDVRIEYRTYSKANAFFITTRNKTFSISIIDGACMGVIAGLDYEYVPDGDKELLIIHFSDNVGLYEDKHYYSPESYFPVLFVLKGSTLIFNITK